MFFICEIQLFRRVAAALPGMEADKKPPEDSILLILLITFDVFIRFLHDAFVLNSLFSSQLRKSI